MKQRASVLRRVFSELATGFEGTGWRRAEGTKTMLEMKAIPSPGIEHTLLMQEPLASSQLPSPDVLGLSCSVNVYFEELETLIAEALGYDPETRGKVSVSLGLCQLAPKESCYLGSVYLVNPADLGDALKRFFADYQRHIEPVRWKLLDLTVFRDREFVPPSVGPAAWSMRRAAYAYLYEENRTTTEVFDDIDRLTARALDKLPAKATDERPVIFGSVAAAVESAARRSWEEVRQLVSTLRQWTSENRKRRRSVH